MSNFTVTLLGVRGGFPVPGPQTVEFGGNTTCLEVHAGPHLIIIDAGTGIIDLGKRLVAQYARDRRPITGTMLFTHSHHDHTQGLPFFVPLRMTDSRFDILGPRIADEHIKYILEQVMQPSLFPIKLEQLAAVRKIHVVQSSDVILLLEPGAPSMVQDLACETAPFPSHAVQIRMHHSVRHPKGGTMCYRIEYMGRSVVFATDTEGYEGGDTKLIRFAQGADLLIHDSEYTDDEYTGPPFAHQGWGHSTWRMAIDVGKKAEVKRLILTHHNARHNDAFMREVEREATAVFARASMAREGMTIEL